MKAVLKKFNTQNLSNELNVHFLTLRVYYRDQADFGNTFTELE